MHRKVGSAERSFDSLALPFPVSISGETMPAVSTMSAEQVPNACVQAVTLTRVALDASRTVDGQLAGVFGAAEATLLHRGLCLLVGPYFLILLITSMIIYF